MEDSDGPFSDLVGLLKSWIPWRSEPANQGSRDFWMPDESCRVCYDCDSQFTLFNRRHHCRICGRIFCAKCTPNWLPCEPNLAIEDWDKIRACNYCFKQRNKEQCKKDLNVGVDDGISVDLPEVICSSPSATSFLSTRSSGTCGSTSTTFVSLPQSAVPSPMQSPSTEADLDRQNVGAAKNNITDVVKMDRNPHDDQIDYFRRRSDDDDDDDYGIGSTGPAARDLPHVNGYYGPIKFEDINSDHNSRKIHPDGDDVDFKSSSSSPLRYSLNSPNSEEPQQISGKDVEHETGDECEAPSSLYVAEDVNSEPVDFENNGVLWLPPEPEDEEDEREALIFEDDGDGDAAGEWGYLNSSNSSGSGEFRSREKSNEEHKRAMKSVVEGHFRALVAQLLQVENLLSEDENDKESWLEIIIALSWEAATLLKPDMSQGGQMDPGRYVKVKCLASGLRSQSVVVRGVVCKKNVAHRRMTSRIEKPRLLILGGALEYQRVSNALSSFDTLLQQEMDHLKMAVAKISVHNPNILLVEKSVSRYAQEYLLAKDISLVLNIKTPLLERIARCTGAQIVPSIDHLSSEKVGYCDLFNVTRFTEEHGSAGQGGKKLVKTLMYFEGCPKPQGCTIILRGASGDELKKVKHVVQYGIFAAYHLALETSFLADEGASLPALPLNSSITVALPEKQSTTDRSISTVPGFSVPSTENTPRPQAVGESQKSNTLPHSDLIRETIASVHEYQSSDRHNIPPPSSSQYGEPLVSSSEKGFQNSSFNQFCADHGSEDQALLDLGLSTEAKPIKEDNAYAPSCFGDPNIKTKENDGCNIDANRNVSNLASLQTDGLKIPDEQHALKEEFPPSPSDHQSILVSLSSRCVWKGTVCERSHLFRIQYYGNFDKPLGRFLRVHLFDQSFVCHSCEMPAEAHVQCYTHRQGTLTISVKKLPEMILPGERDGKIWMWHRCLKCPRANGYPPATRRVLMSDAAWGLSFGKFLELSFSNHAAASRVASCGHSLHRDCLRFYGLGQMVACFRYASIDVHSVYLPPSKLDFNYKNQEWIVKEVNEVRGRAEFLFSEVLNAIVKLSVRKCGKGATNSGMKAHESRHLLTDLEELALREKSIFEEMLQRILKEEAKVGQPIIDIFEINRLRRELVFQSYVWDRRLIYAASLYSNNKPNKVEVCSSETSQKPLGETEKVLDIKTMSSSEFIVADAKLKENHDHGKSGLLLNNHHEAGPQRTPDLSSNSDHGNENPLELSLEVRSVDESDPLASGVNVHKAIFDGSTPISLSDTLDAAWTGESHPSIVTPQNHSVKELAKVDTPSTVQVSTKLEMDDEREDLPSSSCTKISTDVDDAVSWLTTPFSIYYRSSNKNFSGLDLKVDVLSGYNSVYVPLYQDPEFQGGARLLLPIGVNETVIPVFDDEPTSLISYTLVSLDYISQISDEPDKPKDDALLSMHSFDVGSVPSLTSLDEVMLESYKSVGSGDESILTGFRNSLNSDPVSYTKAQHARVSFMDDGPLGKVKYTVTCYYAKRFDALRRISCPSEVDFVRSLSRCKKWGAQGGKSNVFFAKTLDDRFIIKQVTKTELESFIKFAPGYFKYLSESIGTGSPTCLAKILGIYQVSSKHLKGGKETKMDVLVMENLLFGRNITRLYDLKGSSRSRYNPDSSGSNKVLLDQNLIEAMPTSPIFVGNKAKRVLERAVWNDTAFLASIDVMDYSLLVGVDEEKHELVLGIIDFMRQYTWDKHLETWVKTSGILGGPKNASPTVISPKQYKRRFRKAMTTYFLMVPDQWSPPSIIKSQSQSEMAEEKENAAE